MKVYATRHTLRQCIIELTEILKRLQALGTTEQIALKYAKLVETVVQGINKIDFFNEEKQNLLK